VTLLISLRSNSTVAMASSMGCSKEIDNCCLDNAETSKMVKSSKSESESNEQKCDLS
jgi:hypothetical protein